MGLTLITPATGSLVSVAEAKAWARVDGAAEDAVVTTMLASAVAKIEELTGLALAAQGWQLTLDRFSPEIELPIGPVTTVTAIT